jgi:ATP synthase protein I
MHKVLIAQILIVLGVTVAYLALQGWVAAQSAGFGGAITVVSSYLLAQRVKSAGERARESVAGGMALLYLGALQRFVLTLALLVLGLGVLKLAPIPLIVAFAVAQLGFLVNLHEPSRSSRTP